MRNTTCISKDAILLRKLFPLPLARLAGRLRDSFWFLPAVSVVVAIAAAEWVVIVDRSFTLDEVSGFGWTSTTPNAARGILTTLVGSLTSVTGVVLSMMLLILSQTSTQLGPRVVRTVISGNQLQATIAILLATIAFSLTTIRTIRSESAATQYVPETATILCVAAFFVSLGGLIYFVHHVAQMIQAPTVLARISDELAASIDVNRRPTENELEFADNDEERQRVETKSWPVETTITADSDGYLQGYDAVELIEIANAHNAFLRMTPSIGEFVREGAAYCVVRSESAVDSTAIDAIRDAFFVGSRRTPEQDVLAPLLELAEIGIRALSPGINDPRTACMCVDRLTSGLIKYGATVRETSLRLDEDGVPRLLINVAGFGDAVHAAFDGIIHYGRTDPVVQKHIAENLKDLRASISNESADDAIRSLLIALDLA